VLVAMGLLLFGCDERELPPGDEAPEAFASAQCATMPMRLGARLVPGRGWHVRAVATDFAAPDRMSCEVDVWFPADALAGQRVACELGGYMDGQGYDFQGQSGAFEDELPGQCMVEVVTLDGPEGLVSIVYRADVYAGHPRGQDHSFEASGSITAIADGVPSL
jgi:hypothetical protein